MIELQLSTGLVASGGAEGVNFLGEVPVTELITGNTLASAIGLTVGTAQHSNEPWLHFELDGKTLYVAKKPYHNNLSWDHINAVGAVFGTTTVTINGETYKVRLLKGANTDPTPVEAGLNPTGTDQSEWDRLLYSIHNGVHTDDRNKTPPGAWPLYSDQDLLVNQSYGNGSLSLCQETNTVRGTWRVARGVVGITLLNYPAKNYRHANHGWRPVLELVE